MRKNIIKISLTGIVVCITLSTTFFSAVASTVPTESPAESTKEYDDLQKMFLEIDKDITEDELLKLIEEHGVAYTAEYFNDEAFMDALYYNYGTHWDFSEDEPGNVYSGYYYYKPGDTKGGITMKYSNGNTKETGYHSVDSAEDALGDILS